jgi:hypothetical protein
MEVLDRKDLDDLLLKFKRSSDKESFSIFKARAGEKIK